ncbi:MAG: O-antigen ligase family protein [Candidatus Paceibacterota bacterium]|jgi:O-antigen ligase/tetratricopeptide (TPR) repeat protein
MRISRFLYFGVLIGLFILPFLPLGISTSMLFPFITGKNFAFRIIVEIIAALWVVLAFWNKDYRFKKSLVFFLIWGLIIVASLATILGVDPYNSFWSNFERMDGLITLLHLAVLFTILISVFKEEKIWRKYLYTTLLANLLVVFYGLGQLMGLAQIHQGGVRLDASLGNAAYLASYCVFHIFFAAYLIFHEKNLGLKSFLVFSIVINTFVLYFTATRGAILGFLGGIILACILLVVKNHRHHKFRKIAFSILVGVAVLLIIFGIFKDSAFIQSSPVLSRFSSISMTETTTQSRFLIWQMAWQGFRERPILGWGPGNFSYVFGKYYNPLMWRQEPWFDRAHNVIFDWMVSTGALGLLMYLLIFAVSIFYLLKNIYQSNKDSFEEVSLNKKNKRVKEKGDGTSSAVLLGLLAAYFFQNLFVFDNLISYLLFFIVLAYIHFLYTSTRVNAGKEENTNRKLIKTDKTKTSNSIWTTLIISGLFLSLFLYKFNFKPIGASQDIIKALNFSHNPVISLEYYKKVFAAETFANQEAGEQLLGKTLTILQDKIISGELKNHYLNLAMTEWDKNLLTHKNNPRAHFYYGTFLSKIGKHDEALVHLAHAKEFSPKKQMIRFELATLYFKLNRADMAMLELEEAFNLEPNYPEARKMYALGAIIVGENNLALEIIKPIKDNPDYFLDDRFIYYYTQAGEKKEVDYLLEKRIGYYIDNITNNPKNFENYLKLAEAQISLGQNNEGKKNLEMMIELVPEEQKALKTKAQNLLETI